MKCTFIFKNIFFVVPLLGLSVSNVPGVKEKGFGPVQNWPKYDIFGQISAVTVDNSGKVYIFHRGNRRWDRTTFSVNNVFNRKEEGPIPNETIVILHHREGNLITKTGANLFYIPHGLTVDEDNNVWVTDVALHQVFKFPPVDMTNQSSALKKASLTLGVHLEPGSDKKHFCKPTGIVIDRESKEFYVSDGYCNARVIKYDQFGNILLILGRTPTGSTTNHGPYMFNLPHALALAQDKQVLFVADRENFRVMSYDFQSGKFKSSFAEEYGRKVFSVAYSPFEGGLLFVLTNDDAVNKMVALYSIETGKLILSFSPKNNFTTPHDLAISSDGHYCYVVELDPHKIWKFKIDNNIISQISHQPFIKNKNSTENSSVQELVPAESKIYKTSNFETSSSFLAIGLVVTVIVITFFIFMLHCYKRKNGYKKYETRRLIFDEDENGIRLT